MNRSLFERNAQACENAKRPQCRCVCGGQYHGKSHAAVLEELWTQVTEKEKADERAEHRADAHEGP